MSDAPAGQRVLVVYGEPDREFAADLEKAVASLGYAVKLHGFDPGAEDTVSAQLRQMAAGADYLVVVVAPAATGPRVHPAVLNSELLDGIREAGTRVLPVVVGDSAGASLVPKHLRADVSFGLDELVNRIVAPVHSEAGGQKMKGRPEAAEASAVGDPTPHKPLPEPTPTVLRTAPGDPLPPEFPPEVSAEVPGQTTPDACDPALKIRPGPAQSPPTIAKSKFHQKAELVVKILGGCVSLILIIKFLGPLVLPSEGPLRCAQRIASATEMLDLGRPLTASGAFRTIAADAARADDDLCEAMAVRLQGDCDRVMSALDDNDGAGGKYLRALELLAGSGYWRKMNDRELLSDVQKLEKLCPPRLKRRELAHFLRSRAELSLARMLPAGTPASETASNIEKLFSKAYGMFDGLNDCEGKLRVQLGQVDLYRATNDTDAETTAQEIALPEELQDDDPCRSEQLPDALVALVHDSRGHWAFNDKEYSKAVTHFTRAIGVLVGAGPEMSANDVLQYRDRLKNNRFACRTIATLALALNLSRQSELTTWLEGTNLRIDKTVDPIANAWLKIALARLMRETGDFEGAVKLLSDSAERLQNRYSGPQLRIFFELNLELADTHYLQAMDGHKEDCNVETTRQRLDEGLGVLAEFKSGFEPDKWPAPSRLTIDWDKMLKKITRSRQRLAQVGPKDP